MTKTDEYGPDNHRDWDPNHPMLKSGAAPHETSGFMRIHRSGMKGNAIMKMFRVKASHLTKALSKAMEDENNAARQGRDIHDAVFGRSRP